MFSQICHVLTLFLSKKESYFFTGNHFYLVISENALIQITCQPTCLTVRRCFHFCCSHSSQSLLAAIQVSAEWCCLFSWCERKTRCINHWDGDCQERSVGLVFLMAPLRTCSSHTPLPWKDWWGLSLYTFSDSFSDYLLLYRKSLMWLFSMWCLALAVILLYVCVICVSMTLITKILEWKITIHF